MTFPDLPELGTIELVEAWERVVLLDAVRWREKPDEHRVEFLRSSVDKLLEARRAHGEADH